jgi:hypothetical protein
MLHLLGINIVFPGSLVCSKGMMCWDRRFIQYFQRICQPCPRGRIQETLNVLRCHYQINRVTIQLELSALVNDLLRINESLTAIAGVYPTEIITVVLRLYIVCLLPPSLEDARVLYLEIFELVHLIASSWPQMGIIRRLAPIFLEPSGNFHCDLFEEILLELIQQIIRDVQDAPERLDGVESVPMIV